MPNQGDTQSTADHAVDFTRRPVMLTKGHVRSEQHPPMGRPANDRAP